MADFRTPHGLIGADYCASPPEAPMSQAPPGKFTFLVRSKCLRRLGLLGSAGSGGWRSEIWVPVWSGSRESPLPGYGSLMLGCVPTWRNGRGQLSGLLLPGHSSHSRELHPHDLITPRRLRFQIPSHWGQGFDTRILGDTDFHFMTPGDAEADGLGTVLWKGSFSQSQTGRWPPAGPPSAF